MADPRNTTAEDLLRAAEIGKNTGLRYVYAGNLPGGVGDLENTRCHSCGKLLVERYGYLIRAYHLTAEGSCPGCGIAVPGRWQSQFDRQRTAFPFLPRTPRRSRVEV
jgi:pyruvate formate lyase activating enzyme